MKIFYKILNFENRYFSPPPHYKLCETEVSINTSKYVLYMQGYMYYTCMSTPYENAPGRFLRENSNINKISMP